MRCRMRLTGLMVTIRLGNAMEMAVENRDFYRLLSTSMGRKPKGESPERVASDARRRPKPLHPIMKRNKVEWAFFLAAKKLGLPINEDGSLPDDTIEAIAVELSKRAGKAPKVRAIRHWRKTHGFIVARTSAYADALEELSGVPSKYLSSIEP